MRAASQGVIAGSCRNSGGVVGSGFSRADTELHHLPGAVGVSHREIGTGIAAAKGLIGTDIAQDVAALRGHW